MKKYKVVILVTVAAILVIGLVFFLVGAFRPQGAGIFIETIPQSSVFIDGVLTGRTPYEEIRKPGEVVVKLVPESFEKPLAPYETRVSLVSGVQTVIRWEFGESSEQGSGEIVSFEKVSGDETALSIVTVPSSAQIMIDGSTPVFAPYKTSSITQGEHSLLFSLRGFSDRSIRVNTESGYKLTAVVQLAPSPEPPVEEVIQEVQEEEVEVLVEILSTPTGFLRVRAEPSTLGEEIARVEPGETYLFLEEDEETGWFKIEYEEGEEGWVSSTYAEIVEGEDTPVLTPTPESLPSPTI